MITLFTTPKKFEGHFKTIQTNAIKSWTNIDPKMEIIIFDENKEAQIIAKRNQAIYITDIKKNEKGTPYLSYMFQQAQKISKYKICCYINCDIIITENFATTIKTIHERFKSNYLVIGSRYDLDWDKIIDFSNSEALIEFQKIAKENSKKHSVSGIDYFAFPKGFYKDMPDFLAGRVGFDNWLIWCARKKRAAVIDASEEIFAIHQNHDYSHLKGGRFDAFEGEEALYNKKYLGTDSYKGFNLLDSTWKFRQGVLSKKKEKEEINRYLGKLQYIYPEYARIMNLYKRFYRKFFLK